MRKIILLAQSIESAQQRQEALLSAFENCEITTCLTEKEAMWIILSESFDLGVIETSELRENQAHFGELVRTSGYNFPLIIIGPFEKQTKFLKKLPKRSNMIFLSHPVMDKQLIGIGNKLLLTGASYQPTSPRYTASELVWVEKYGTKRQYDSTVLDISRGGAKLEFQPGERAEIVRGDFLRVNFKKSKKVNGQVRWAKKDRKTGKSYVGVEFI